MPVIGETASWARSTASVSKRVSPGGSTLNDNAAWASPAARAFRYRSPAARADSAAAVDPDPASPPRPENPTMPTTEATSTTANPPAAIASVRRRRHHAGRGAPAAAGSPSTIGERHALSR